MFPRFIPLKYIFTKGSQKGENILIPAKYLKKALQTKH